MARRESNLLRRARGTGGILFGACALLAACASSVPSPKVPDGPDAARDAAHDGLLPDAASGSAHDLTLDEDASFHADAPAGEPAPGLSEASASLDGGAPPTGLVHRFGMGATLRVNRDAGLTTDASTSNEPPLPERAFGAGSIRASDAHPFRLAVDIRGVRQVPAGQRALAMLGRLPDVVAFRKATSVDPATDGTSLLVFGKDVDVPGSNANVLQHSRPAAEVARAIDHSGMTTLDLAAPASSVLRSVKSRLFGSADVLALKRSGMLELLPRDRASELVASVGEAPDLGLGKKHVASLFVEHPSRLSRMIPSELSHATFTASPTPDRGFDVEARATCPDEAKCAAIADQLRARVRNSDGLLVRALTHGVLTPLASPGKAGQPGIRADKAILHARVHIDEDQALTLIGLLGASIGTP